jgi:hypothetical protein
MSQQTKSPEAKQRAKVTAEVVAAERKRYRGRLGRAGNAVRIGLNCGGGRRVQSTVGMLK